MYAGKPSEQAFQMHARNFKPLVNGGDMKDTKELDG
jgi:hypothetical protein